MVSQSERPMDFLPKVFHDHTICYPSEAVASSARSPTGLADPHSGTTWRDWKVSFGQLLVGSDMTSAVQDFVRSWERRPAQRFPGNLEPHKELLYLHPPPLPPTSHLLSHRTKFTHGSVKPGHVTSNKTTAKQANPWLVDPVGLLALTLFPLSFPDTLVCDCMPTLLSQKTWTAQHRGGCAPDTWEHHDLLTLQTTETVWNGVPVWSSVPCVTGASESREGLKVCVPAAQSTACLSSIQSLWLPQMGWLSF